VVTGAATVVAGSGPVASLTSRGVSFSPERPESALWEPHRHHGGSLAAAARSRIPRGPTTACA